MMEFDFRVIFSKIPLLKTMSPDDFEIKPLSGLTNLNFHLLNERHDYVLRIPRAQTNHMLNRKAEAFNVDQVIQIGLAPNLLWCDDSGLSLTRCITQSRALTTTDMQDEVVLSLLLDRLAVLQCSELTFRGETDLAALISRYFNLVPIDRNLELAVYFEKALSFNQAFAENERKVPSHNDLVLENLLLDHRGRLWMIDWEYSGMSSPYWDIATLCNTARLAPKQTRRLLNGYSKQVIELNFDHLRRYQYMLQVLSIGWLIAFTTESIEIELDWLNQLGV